MKGLVDAGRALFMQVLLCHLSIWFICLDEANKAHLISDIESISVGDSHATHLLPPFWCELPSGLPTRVSNPPSSPGNLPAFPDITSTPPFLSVFLNTNMQHLCPRGTCQASEIQRWSPDYMLAIGKRLCSTKLLKVSLGYQPLNVSLPNIELAVLGQVYGPARGG